MISRDQCGAHGHMEVRDQYIKTSSLDNGARDSDMCDYLGCTTHQSLFKNE